MSISLSNQCTYRLAIEEDVSAIQNCASVAYEKYVQRIGRPPAPMVADFAVHVAKKEVTVAIYDKKLIGYVVSISTDDAMMLENVAVDPAFSGGGVGTALIRIVEKNAEGLGASCIYLYTNEAMTENIPFYNSLGYVEYKRATESNFKRVYFKKSL